MDRETLAGSADFSRMQEFGFDNAAYSPGQFDITREVFVQFKRGLGQPWPPMALSPTAIPVGIKLVNRTLSVPGGATKPLPTRAATDQNVQLTRGKIGLNCQFGVLRNGKISLSQTWGQMLHVLMDQLRRDGLDSQDSIGEGEGEGEGEAVQ
ncbi:hypothetical protein LOY47_10980 [Pseudomonas brassicacearum]|uniref:hypothetical protein n=1 Tax=Pseudomonas brassicacearum TaxID=930166 RepID=UPI00215F7E63|nr:hypothetical protein [Pseudomonas brassicacearum]UVM46757.1 hypothetical protein LOY47_10980 [Pseudomonas brassicacearum]